MSLRFDKKTVASTICAAILAVGAAGIALGDDDDREGREGRSEHGGWMGRGHDVPPVTNERYRTECGSCHFAYQPGLLPADAWTRVMGQLDNHFGDDASLEPAVAKEILDYLTANAASGDKSIRSRAFAAKPIAGDAPPRITQTAYFQRKHDEIPARMVKGNPKVGSFSSCASCHQGAEQGNFNESSVSIPGFGRWED